MSDWSERLLKVAVEMERQLDRSKARLGQKLGEPDPLMIVPYRGYGTRTCLRLKARVLEDFGIGATLDTQSALRNLVDMYRRFESDEVPGARVRAQFGNIVRDFTANDEGFVDIELDVPDGVPATTVWHEVELTLLEPVPPRPVQARGIVLVPTATAGFGVISDLDDTVIQTNVGNLVRMARTVFLGNARTRVAFPGVSSFYRALQSDGAGGSFNPLFYVSSSPWNLHDLLVEFLMLAQIPLGPIVLRDWGLSTRGLDPGPHRSHKLDAIRSIFDTYPTLPFLLIGDSSEEDPEIYSEVVTLYPGRVKAIYIRNVSRDLARPEAIKALAARVTEAGSALVLANDTNGAAQHAIEMGYVAAASLPEIETARRVEAVDAMTPPAPVVHVAPSAPAAGTVVEDALQTADATEAQAPTVVVDGGN